MDLLTLGNRIAGGSAWAPAGLYSRVVATAARVELPSPLRRVAWSAFARAVGADLDEPEQPLDGYRTLGDFFARRLRAGARPVASDAELVQPCDGVVLATGQCDGQRAVQAKGHDYTLAELLADDTLAQELSGGTFATIYLSPRDYHRVHSPVAGRLVGYRHVPGRLWPVGPRYVEKVPDLYTRNERAIAVIETAFGPVAVVLVGTVGVGNLWLRWAGRDGATTEALRGQPGPTDVPCAAPVTLAAGDELGAFQLGSTVVVVYPPGAVELDASPGQVVRCGARAGRRAGGHGGGR